jgi:UDP-N-acetyl-D-mannosaminuronic acid dehydrogenase
MATRDQYDVLILGGFGHVGLPLGITLADGGLQVGLYDIDESKRSTIEAGRMPFLEEGAEPVLQRVMGRTLHVSDDLSDAAHSRSLLITIGTPVDEYLNPETRPLLDLAAHLLPHLQTGHHLILRSTVYPGTSRVLHDFFRRQGKVVHLSNCPERIVQGAAMRELRELPQIVSGFSEEAVARSQELFRRLGVETVVVEVEEAELAKLFLNAWRYIQFAVANQFYTMTEDCGVDYDRVHYAMTHRYARGNLPRPGFAAGPCLLKDTLQLAAAFQNRFQLGHAAMLVNEGLPNFLVQQLLHRRGCTLAGTRVGVLGMAFKADSDDTRDSLSYRLVKVLIFHGAEVLCSDEFVRDPSFVPKEELVERSSIIIVGVPHTAYRSLHVPPGKCTVDLWGILPR